MHLAVRASKIASVSSSLPAPPLATHTGASTATSPPKATRSRPSPVGVRTQMAPADGRNRAAGRRPDATGAAPCRRRPYVPSGARQSRRGRSGERPGIDAVAEKRRIALCRFPAEQLRRPAASTRGKSRSVLGHHGPPPEPPRSWWRRHGAVGRSTRRWRLFAVGHQCTKSFPDGPAVQNGQHIISQRSDELRFLRDDM